MPKMPFSYKMEKGIYYLSKCLKIDYYKLYTPLFKIGKRDPQKYTSKNNIQFKGKNYLLFI